MLKNHYKKAGHTLLFQSFIVATMFCLSHSAFSAVAPSTPIVIKPMNVEIEKGVKLSDKGRIIMRNPDKTLNATISALNENNESRLVIRDANGKVLLKKDFSSPDMNHGLVIMRAAWSPDSKFFFFTLESSGGHQPWRVASEFYSRANNQLTDLEEYLQPMGSMNFMIQSPDIVTISMWTRKGPNGMYEYTLPITFHLSDIKPH